MGIVKSAKSGLAVRTQFTFAVNDRTLNRILSRIAKYSVNIAALVTIKRNKKCNIVRLVVGSSKAETTQQLLIVVKTLKSLGVRYKVEKVISISTIPAGVPGGYNRLIGSLWCKVQLKSFYLGENNVIYLNVSNIPKTIKILSQRKPKPCLKNG